MSPYAYSSSPKPFVPIAPLDAPPTGAAAKHKSKSKDHPSRDDCSTDSSDPVVGRTLSPTKDRDKTSKSKERHGGDSEETAKRAGKGKKPPREGSSSSSSSRGGEDSLSSSPSASTLGRRSGHEFGAHAESPRGSVLRSDDGAPLASPPTRSLSVLLERRERTKSREKDDSNGSSSSEAGDRDERTRGKTPRDRDARDRGVDEKPKRSGSLILQRPRSATGASPTGVGQQQASSPRKPGRKSPSTDDLMAMSDGAFVSRPDFNYRSAGEGSDPAASSGGSAKKDKTRDKVREDDKDRGDKKWPRSDRDLPRGYSGLEPSASSTGDTTPRKQHAAPRARSSTQSPYKEASHYAGGADASREADSPRRHVFSASHAPIPSSSSSASGASSPLEPSTTYSRSPTSAFLQLSPRAASGEKKRHARHNSESLLAPAVDDHMLGRSNDGGTGDEANKPSRHPLRSRRVRQPSHSRPKSPKTDEWPEADSEWAEEEDDEREEWERTTCPAAASDDLPAPVSSRDRKKSMSAEDGGSGRSRTRESSSEDSESDSSEPARDRDRRSRRSRHDDHGATYRDKGKTKDRAMHSGGGSPTKTDHQQEPGSHEAISPTKPASDAALLSPRTTAAPPPDATRPMTGSLTKEDAALLLQKVFRGSLGRRQGRKQALLTAWELLDYDDERKTVRQTERAYKLETMARDSLRELQLKEYFKHRAQRASSGSGSAESGTSESESEVEVEVEVGEAEQEAQVSVTEDTEEATDVSEGEDRDRHRHRKEERGRHGDHASSSSSSSEGSRTKERRRDGESSSSSCSSSSKGHDERRKQREESERDHQARKLRKKKKSLVYFKVDLQPHQPITPKIVSKLINHFKDGEVLDEKDATEILRQMKEWYYKHGSAVVDLDVPEGSTLTICGDVHGQLDDALTIFRLNGLPSEQSAYLFNGDLVDRGRYGMEICLLLFAIKLSQEGTLHINRGNHECRRMNERYSFEKEVLLKYDDRMFKRIQKVFNQLPIAALIRNKIFVTHGGLFREPDLTIDEIRRMDYRMDIPIKANDRMAQAFIDLMWSDPRPTQGIGNSKRGAGAYFGPDITATFIERNSLELVIRSHEMVPWGYSVAHDHKVVTVFSASSYCGTNDNFGAYLTFKHDLVPVFHRFQADSLRNISRTFSAEELKTETTRKLRERIFENRYNLAVAFAQIDEQRTGKVSRIQWAQIMGDVLRLSSMPWLSLQPMLAKASKDRNNAKVIKYKHFLARYQVLLNHQLVDSWEDLLVREVCQKLYDSGENLCEEFKKVDTEDSGLVEREDFVKTIKNLRVGFGDLEIQSLLASCATADNKVNYREWIKKLHVVYTEIEFAHRETEDWLEMAIQEIGMEIAKREEDMDALFKQFDEDQDGELSAKEFDKLLKHLGLNNKHSKVQRERVVRHITKQPKEANITHHDFVAALKVDMDDWRWKERVIQHMCYIFFKNRYELLTVFRSFNTSGSGIINQQEFKAGMKTLKKLLNVSLSSVQLEKLYEVIDADGDGLISTAEFLDAFQVVDVGQENRKAARTRSEPA